MDKHFCDIHTEKNPEMTGAVGVIIWSTWFCILSVIKYNISNESINEALKSDEKMVLELIRENSRISQKIIAEKTEYSRSKVQRILKILQEKGILYRQGSRKKGEWIIVEPKEMKL